MRNLIVKESKAAKIDLSIEEAGALSVLGEQLSSAKTYWASDSQSDEGAESEKTIVRCRPLNAPGVYEVIVDNAVGMIGVGDLRLSVQPKIPSNHLIFLLNRAAHLPRSVAQGAEASGDENIIQLLPLWYASALESVLRHDLVRDYREMSDDLGAVRGSLSVEGTVGNYYRGSLAINCTYSEFDEDTALNRLLRAAALKILSNPLIRDVTRARRRKCAARFDGVSEYRADDRVAQTDRRTSHYSHALWLAQAVLRSETRSVHHGSKSAWCFLFPTPWAVEEGIRTILRSELRDLCLVEKRGKALG